MGRRSGQWLVVSGQGLAVGERLGVRATQRKRSFAAGVGSFALAFAVLVVSLATSVPRTPSSAESALDLLLVAASVPAAVTHASAPVAAPAASSITLKSYVLDADDNKIMYNRVTGMVFSEIGIVYNQDSQPLTYDDKTQEFEDSLQRRLDLIEKSTGGLQNYYLMFGSYKVRSIGIDDELFLVGIKANTAFNSGKEYDMLITRVWVKRGFWENFLKALSGSYSGGYYEYYDLHGHKIDSKYFQSTTRPNLIAGSGTAAFGGTVFTKFEKWGTIRDLLDEIVFLMEQVPPTGSPMGDFALNPVTGAFLRDDRGQKIRIKDGQLIDPMAWPLIGADARPLWWREDLRSYTNHKGELLDFDPDDVLREQNGFTAHSIITDVINGKRIYLVYIWVFAEHFPDGYMCLIPATAKTISTKPYKAEFYDMNGVLIPESEFIEPDVSVDDRKENWPEEFPDDDPWGWLKFAAKTFGDWLADFFKGLPDTVFIVLLIVAGVIAFGIVLKFLSWVFKDNGK